MVDESTDVSCSKHLCVVTRVFEKHKVTDSFFDLNPVTDVSADGLYGALTGTFQGTGVPYELALLQMAQGS